MRLRAPALLMGAALLLGGCGASPASRAGGGETLTVTLGTADPAGRPTEPLISAFAEEVESETGGAVKMQTQWAPDRANPSEESVARSLASGDLQFALVPSRAWDLLGVDTLRPLQLPGLIVTDAAAAAVASDGVADELLGGLSQVGVTGLALVPDGVRRLYVIPPQTPERFTSQGAGIRSIASDASEEIFGLVGATTSDSSGIDLDAAILSGEVSAVESSWNLLDTFPKSVSGLGDLPLFTKFDVIAVNSDWFASRTEGERAAIRAAAARAASRFIAGSVSDADEAAAYCSSGGTIGHASPATASAFATARDTIERRWRSDSTASQVIDRLEQVVAGAPTSAQIPFCAAQTTNPTPESTMAAQTDFPGGVYRMNVSTDELISAGMSATEAADHAGIWTLTFRDGNLVIGNLGFDCHGQYVVHGDRVELHPGQDAACGGAAGGMLFSANWRTDGAVLTFSAVSSGAGAEPDAFQQALFQGRPFTKIG